MSLNSCGYRRACDGYSAGLYFSCPFLTTRACALDLPKFFKPFQGSMSCHHQPVIHIQNTGKWYNIWLPGRHSYPRIFSTRLPYRSRRICPLFHINSEFYFDIAIAGQIFYHRMILNSGKSSIHEIYELGISREPTRNHSLLIPGLTSFFFAFFAELNNPDQPKLVRGSFHLPDWHPTLLCRFIPCLFFNQASSKIDQLNPREGFFSLSLKSRQNEVNKMNVSVKMTTSFSW